jgi:3-phenylpropionate/trans-cinnamate dioxygenase ferredoxin reductase subunit
MEKERLYLRPESYYSEQGITLRLGQPVTEIDPEAQSVKIGSEILEYDQLVLTTGSSPRRLPASIVGDLQGVHVVRDLRDVDAMEPYCQEGCHVLVCGGGYIGLEAAAVASKLGLKVTVVEMAERILQRVAAPETSNYFRDLHTRHGVDIREGVGLNKLIGEGRVTGAELTDGSILDVDFVIAGVGITPNDGLAQKAGLSTENGIETDPFGRTSDANIWAAGDCASHPRDGVQLRVESVQNAIDQAELVADNIMGQNKEYAPHPWFWSDQYDVKLQIAGLNTGYDQVVTRVGDKPGAASHWYYEGTNLLAVDAMNDPRAYMVGKRLIEAGKHPNASLISDPETDLKELLKT